MTDDEIVRPELVNLTKAESTYQIRCRYPEDGMLYLCAEDLLTYLSFKEDIGAAVYMLGQACREMKP